MKSGGKGIRHGYYAAQEPFEVTITVDPEQLKLADHDDIKLRNLPSQFQLSGRDNEAGVISSPNVVNEKDIVGGVDDLIGLTHLHEPAILHALRLRYDNDIIYTATGPILIAVNPFKAMPLYSPETMESYRIQGESRPKCSVGVTPGKFKAQPRFRRNNRLPPHVYQTADDAYRSMMRGIENVALVTKGARVSVETNQSILVSGESGAGKTVTTKIVLNYFAMLSRKRAEEEGLRSPKVDNLTELEDVSIEQQVLQSNPILESFGNARTIRNDNSSRFGKYIDVTFSGMGKVSGASIETYLLEKVRLIHPGTGERNYHVFYQFLASATDLEREEFLIGDLTEQDFTLLSQSGTFTRRDGVNDEDMHQEMLDAMITIGFTPEQIQNLVRLVCAILFLGNITFTPHHHDHTDDPSCTMDDNQFSRCAADLLGVSFDDLASSLTSRTILAGYEVLEKTLMQEEAMKAMEALIKATYGGAFSYIVDKINESIDDEHEVYVGNQDRRNSSQKCLFHVPQASIGVLDIFGFETFESNSFEQICINYTNEALQQQFNKYVFKLEQQEYEREGILWKFISFPDNQDVLDLIDQRRSGILSILDDQCMLPKGVDSKFCRFLYQRCDSHQRFSASAKQRVRFQFSIEHYAGPVEYNTDGWIEKNKDQLPVKGFELLDRSTFDLLKDIKMYVRCEERNGRGSIATKSVGAQFSAQLRSLRDRIDRTVPHYIRCLKPNDDLVPDMFEPKNIVEQLRCGGVLEAVRVSRAGYPTRYPHELFMGRYYIMIKNQLDKCGAYMGREERLRALVDKIALYVWEEDHDLVLSIMENESRRSGVSKNKTRGNQTGGVHLTPTRISNGRPMAIEGPYDTPQPRSSSITGGRSLESSHEILRPETKEEFMALDFSSRCAVAGLQLGKSKVFIRREAFDRIEAMRSKFFFDAATVIQKMFRGKYYLMKFQMLRCAAVLVQSFIRMAIAKGDLAVLRFHSAAKKIQMAWRNKGLRDNEYNAYQDMRSSSVAIQRIFRSYRAKKERAIMQKSYKQRMKEYSAAVHIQKYLRGILVRVKLNIDIIILSVIKLQAIVRSKLVRIRAIQAQGEAEDAALALLAIPPPMPPTQTPTKHSPKPIATPPSPDPVASPPPPLETPSSTRSKRQLPPLSTSLLPAAPQAASTNSVSSAQATTLFQYITTSQWVKVESLLDACPELSETVHPSSGELPLHAIAQQPTAWTLLIDMVLVLHPKALVHRDRAGALPVHHAAAHDNLAALEIIYAAYKEGVNEVDGRGRLPLHVAAEFDAVDAVKFLLAKGPEGAYTMVHRPGEEDGGGLPLHVACRNYASIGVITALLAENFASAKRSDERGDLPLHLLLRCGDVVDQVVVKTLLTCFSSAVSRTDSNGDLPLSIALKNSCKPAVVNTLLIQYPDAAGIVNGSGHSPLHLAFENGADDRTILGLLNHAPELATAIDKQTGLFPIQVAAQHDHSPFIIHNLLKRDMPIDLKEKVRAQLLPHHYSWNHVVAHTQDRYHTVVAKLLQQCTQPQVLALAHVEDTEGRIALAAATPVCKYELRVMLRLFNTLEVVNQRPAYTNPLSDTQIFYALRYEPPPSSHPGGGFTILHEDKSEDALGDYIEEWDDSSHVSGLSRNSGRSVMSNRSQQSIDDRLRYIRKEKGQQVIAKLTSRSDVVERELRVRKEYHLSRHYVPAIISVHHTVQHAAYSEAMAEPGYCITMEGADTTAENMILDLRKSSESFPLKALKRIGISLLHLHEHGIVHGDFGTHNIGKFGSRWKLLGVGGSVPVGEPTDPKRGFYHPPESIAVEGKRSSLGKKSLSASVISVAALPSYDIWAYGVVLYEAVAAVPLSPYACRGKRAMTSAETAKIGKWDESYIKKSLKCVDNELARDILRGLLCGVERRYKSMKEVLDHEFFKAENHANSGRRSEGSVRSSKTSLTTSVRHSGASQASIKNGSPSRRQLQLQPELHDENSVNGVPKNGTNFITLDVEPSARNSNMSTSSSRRSGKSFKVLKNSLMKRRSGESERRGVASS